MSILERITYFHNEIKSGRYPKIQSIIEKFEVSESTARRDIEYLRERLGAQLNFNRKKRGYEYSKDFTLPTDNIPVLAHLVGIYNSLIDTRGTNVNDELKRARDLLANALSIDPNKIESFIHIERPEHSPVNNDIMKEILNALIKGHSIKIEYEKPDGTKSEREVEPCRLIDYHWTWYLFGYCHKQKDYRIFNLSGILGCEITDKKVTRCEANRMGVRQKSFPQRN